MRYAFILSPSARYASWYERETDRERELCYISVGAIIRAKTKEGEQSVCKDMKRNPSKKTKRKRRRRFTKKTVHECNADAMQGKKGKGEKK